MSDLVFLLLIFFMLTSTLISPNAVKLFLPESNNKTMAKESVTIYISDLGVGGDATSPLSRCQFQIDDTPLTANAPAVKPTARPGRSAMDMAIKPARTGSMKPNASPPTVLKNAARGVFMPKFDGSML